MRQGCPLSSILFILCVEILAIIIRNNKDINGIRIGDEELKLAQFADDTTAIIRDEQSMYELFRVTEEFSQYSGLKLNTDKTILIWIGPWKTKTNTILNLKTSEDTFNNLGIDLGYDKIKCTEANFTKKIKKMEKNTIYGLEETYLLLAKY